MGDLNGDCFLDFILTYINGVSFNHHGELEVASGPLFVWMNGGGDNNWVSFKLQGRMAVDGTGSNADAIGAKVTVFHNSEGEELITQTREVMGSSSFLSMSSLDSHFGVGVATSVDVSIDWPSGKNTKIENISVNSLHEITEAAN